jgi:acyl-coenzyme A synthetase/AMP-(fatty) acid ligase
LREEHKLRVFDNRLLRKIFGPKRDEVTRKWRKLHSEDVSNFYSSPNIVRMIKSRRMRWTGHVALMGERRGVYRISVGEPEGK